jgi:uncharacterized protein
MPAAVVVRNSPIHGTGVFATRDIAEGEEIIEYTGRLMTHAEADAVYPEDDGHTFLYILNDDYVIDATVGGNEARWINHSCAPNCETIGIESDDGDPAKERLVITAIRDIRAGEELTYEYGIVTDEPVTDEVRAMWVCRCGSPKCRGTMLEADSETAAQV